VTVGDGGVGQLVKVWSGWSRRGLGGRAVLGGYLDGLSSVLPVTTDGIRGQCGDGGEGC